MLEDSRAAYGKRHVSGVAIWRAVEATYNGELRYRILYCFTK